MKKIIKTLKYIPFLIILILDIVLSTSYNTVLNQENIYKSPNLSMQNFSIPTYTPPKEETPKIEVAPINDKEDAQGSREVDKRGPISVNEIKQYETSGTSIGIDVSKWQNNINWQKVKADGIEFAMIRVGYRGSVTGKIVMDPYFEKNIKEALANGIHVGVYFFSMAINETEAIEEANWTINVIKKYHITYPVAFDLESFGKDRLANVDNQQLNKNAIAFLNRIQSAGYTPMHYGNKNSFKNTWNMGTLNKYKVWLAHYTDKTDYSGKYNMWQYTSTGRVNGISGNVDLNIAYFKLSSNANEEVKDDSSLSIDPNEMAIQKVTFKEVNEEVITITNATFRKSPTLELDNKITTINKDVKIVRIGTSTTWSKVQYNNQIGYILNSELQKYTEPEPPETPEIEEPTC